MVRLSFGAMPIAWAARDTLLVFTPLETKPSDLSNQFAVKREWDVQVGGVGLTPLAPTISNRCCEVRRNGRRERVSA
jgi:hypothetical protein